MQIDFQGDYPFGFRPVRLSICSTLLDGSSRWGPDLGLCRQRSPARFLLVVRTWSRVDSAGDSGLLLIGTYTSCAPDVDRAHKPIRA